MPLDTSSYTLAHLRLDGRRWNELRHLDAQISTQAAADGSSYLEMGNTKLICTVRGPSEPTRNTSSSSSSSSDASIDVTINLAGFSSLDRKRPSGTSDRRLQEMQSMISSAFASTVFTHMYPHSTIEITCHVLNQDGSLLAACINATTLALIDAGVPMADYISACTAGSTASYSQTDDRADPLLDLNSLEEQELPYLTVATVGEEDKVAVLNVETRVQVGRLESMMTVGVEGCRRVRGFLDRTVRAHGKVIVEKGRHKTK